MHKASLQTVCCYLRRFGSANQETSDGLLLQRYRESRDATAFAALVQRHGPMVLGVCRRILGQPADSEDAFQATFLALASQASSVREPDRLAAWLHRIAYRIATKARTQIYQWATEQLPPLETDDDPVANVTWREVRQILDEELNRLPERLRDPLVLCYLDGAARDEAARRLGWSLSTLKRRLEQAQALLRVRLKSRGIASLGLAAAILAPGGLRAAVPAKLLKGTSALGSAAGSITGVSSRILALAKEGIPPMSTFSFRTIWGVLLVTGGLALGVMPFTRAAGPSDPISPSPMPGNPPAVQPALDGKGPRTDRFGDVLPPGVLHRFGTVRFRHGGGFNDAALSHDGKTLIATSEIGITLFDVETGKPRLPLRSSEVPNGFGKDNTLVSFAPDGAVFASVAHDGTIRIWDAATGKELRRLGNPKNNRLGGIRVVKQPAPPAADFHASSVRFTDGGKAILAGGPAGEVRYLDAQKGDTIRQFNLGGSLVGLSADEKTLLSIQEKNKAQVVLHDAQTGEVRKRFDGEGTLDTATLSPNGKYLVAVNEDSLLIIWDAVTGKELRKTQVKVAASRRGAVNALAVTPDNQTLLAGTTHGEIQRWDLATGKELTPLDAHHGDYVTGLLFPPDGKTLISVGWDGMLRRWDLATAKPYPSGDGYADHIHAIDSPDGRWVIAGCGEGRLDVYDRATGKLTQALREVGPPVNRLAFSPDGKTLAVAQGDNQVTLWDTGTWSQVRSIALPTDPKDGKRAWVADLKFSPDGRTLLTSSEHDGTRLWELATGKELWHQKREGMAAFAPDGKSLVTGGWGRTLYIRDPSTGQASVTLELSEREIIDDIRFSPNGRILATCHHDGSVRLRDPATGREIRKLQITHEVVWEIDFSADSKWLFTTGNDHVVRLHEVATGQEVLHLAGHDSRVYHGRLGADGKSALTASWDLTALLWSLRPAKVPTAKDNLDALWEDLHSDQGPVAYRAVWALQDAPVEAVRLLRAKLPPAKSDLDLPQIRKLVEELDSDRFRTREAAMKSLAEKGAAIVPILREKLPQTKSAEQRRRIKDLLDRLEQGPTADDWRVMRAVQVLELSSGPEARQLLKEWAGGAPGVLLTEQAKEALRRGK